MSPIHKHLKEVGLKNRLIYKAYLSILAWVLISSNISCKKLVEIPEPVNSITTPEAFNTSANAISAIISIYNDISVGYNGGNMVYGNGITTLYAGLSSDELNYNLTDDAVLQFQTNQLQPNNTFINSSIWYPAYFDIYLANSAIEGLTASKVISDSLRNELMGEAKFFRAFCHFYLVNLFGDIPLITTTAWAKTNTMTRSTVDDVYKQIIADLTDAQKSLTADYAISSGERVRVNKWAAEALLARVYLYKGAYEDAESAATDVISNTGLFNLETDLNKVFLANSGEAILQLKTNTSFTKYATYEGATIIPAYLTSDYPPDVISQYPSFFIPTYYLSSKLVNAFESGDQRMSSWVEAADVNGTTYYYPYKYKVRAGAAGNTTEYYMLLRLGEQFLIRAEARARQNKLADAISDLNTIRGRANLAPLLNTLNQTEVINATFQERRIELFAEWGHRWLDLNRANMADTVLPSIKSNWTPNAHLYPIPLTEIQRNPRLTQNQGYN